MIEIDGLVFERNGRAALRVDALRIDRGERLAVLGPSGSGKTTLLRLIAGLERPSRGRLEFSGGTGSHGPCPPPWARGVGWLSQDLGLWPHLTAVQHLALVRSRGGSLKPTREDFEGLERVGLEQRTARTPHQLSGGEQQRLALARALAARPRLLLLDEPFAHIDRVLRDDLLGLLETVLAEQDMACLLVTHALEEARRLAGRALVLQEGHPIQAGTWTELNDEPRTEWVRRLMGQ